MIKRFDCYYLQRNAGDGWDTLAQSETPEAVVGRISELLDQRDQSEIRIVGAAFDEPAADWAYHQLFYLDQSGIDFSTTSADMVERDAIAALSGAETADAAPLTASEALDGPDDGPDRGRPPVPAAGSVGEGRQPFGEQEITPWAPDRDAAPARNPAAAPGEPEPGGALFYGLVAVLVIVLVAVGSMLYAKHPLVVTAIEALGLGDYVRLAAERVAEPRPEPPKPADSDNPPFASGPVTRQAGVAPALHGRWSAEDCRHNYIAFGKTGYRRVAPGLAAGRDTRVVETLRDEFQFHLRLSPNIVEHFRKITENDIMHAGTTTARGYHSSTGQTEIYSRCR